MKAYLVPAVALLMLVTSMGIFGFLSKAHSDQSLVSGDVQSKIAIYDEKIKTEKENIEANRRALKQMDEGVDQVLGRSTDEKGADKAVALRRSQQKERARLQKEISQSQQSIAQLNEARAPIAAEVRKVEAEVGPIKYIAALVYGNNPDANLLEAAVRWVIILLVVVFDPLAIMMLLAATESLKWEREPKVVEPAYEQDDGPLTAEQIEQVKATAMRFNDPGEHPKDFDEKDVEEPVEVEKSILEQHPYLKEPFVHFKDLKPMVASPVKRTINDFVPQPQELVDDEDESVSDSEKAAIRAWKTSNPGETIKHQRQLFEDGKIDRLPWDLHLVADNQPPVGSMRGFGIQWPDQPVKGDTFLRVDRLPSALYKYNGKSWIEIDKKISDQYSYDTAYIDHLISKIDSGEYDPDLLTDAEVEQIQQRFRSRNS